MAGARGWGGVSRVFSSALDSPVSCTDPRAVFSPTNRYRRKRSRTVVTLVLLHSPVLGSAARGAAVGCSRAPALPPLIPSPLLLSPCLRAEAPPYSERDGAALVPVPLPGRDEHPRDTGPGWAPQRLLFRPVMPGGAPRVRWGP